MSKNDPIVIVAAARTPLGRFQGELAPLPAPALGAGVIRAALERAALTPDRVDEVLMGCVLPAGQGQAPARQAVRGAGLPDATGATASRNSFLAPLVLSGSMANEREGQTWALRSLVCTLRR